MGVRRGRTDSTFREAALVDLVRLTTSVDPETYRQAWGATAKLAALHRLTRYDAAYLELSRRRSLPLATIASEVGAAATAGDVALPGLRE